jgi:hypothetical protein
MLKAIERCKRERDFDQRSESGTERKRCSNVQWTVEVAFPDELETHRRSVADNRARLPIADCVELLLGRTAIHSSVNPEHQDLPAISACCVRERLIQTANHGAR